MCMTDMAHRELRQLVAAGNSEHFELFAPHLGSRSADAVDHEYHLPTLQGPCHAPKGLRAGEQSHHVREDRFAKAIFDHVQRHVANCDLFDQSLTASSDFGSILIRRTRWRVLGTVELLQSPPRVGLSSDVPRRVGSTDRRLAADRRKQGTNASRPTAIPSSKPIALEAKTQVAIAAAIQGRFDACFDCCRNSAICSATGIGSAGTQRLLVTRQTVLRCGPRIKSMAIDTRSATA